MQHPPEYAESMDPGHLAAMRTAWVGLRSRYAAYELLMPGDPSFVCQPHACDAHCCRKFSVSAGEQDRARMVAETGLQPAEFLESENGRPIELPLAKPYLLKRGDNRCALLGEDLGCSVYTGRPNACRQYPYQVLFATPEGEVARLSRSEALATIKRPTAGAIALLARHIECPGFTSDPLTVETWRDLRRSTLELQLGD